MYAEIVQDLYINKSKLRVKTHKGYINFDTTVKEISRLYTGNLLGQYSPDFYIKGELSPTKGGYPTFLVKEDGSHTLYITGLSKECLDMSKYKFSNTLFSSYWEQKNYGFLFQIITNK